MLRLVKQSDIEPIYSIYMHESIIPYMGYDPMPVKGFLPIFKELVESQCFFVLDIESEIKGCCRVNRHKGRARHVASLFTLAVSIKEQGTGVAQLLMELIFEHLQTNGIRRVELMVEEDNPRAFNFYEKLGFEHEGTMRSAYKRSHESHYIDELLLVKYLS